MDLANIVSNSRTPVTAQNTSAAATDQSRASLASNYQTFLTLLTAQLQNQDPLNPTDSNEFTQQLTQFSQVEQQIRTNEQLDSLVRVSANNSAGVAVGWIGRTVELAGSAVKVAGEEAANWRLDATTAAGPARWSVKDSLGRVVATGEAAAGGQRDISWTPPAGTAPNTYTLEAVTGSDNTKLAVVSLQRVTGVDFTGPSPRITTATGNFDLSAVRKLSL